MSRLLDYVLQFKQLLPRGRLWESLKDDPVLDGYIKAECEEDVRIESRALNLINETNPLKTFELLPEWEAWAGLPEPCLAGESRTLKQRQIVLHAKLTRKGGQSIDYYISLAADIGFEITITEFDPFSVESTVDETILSDDWAFAWQVNAPEETVTYFNAASDVDTALAFWGNELLECVITRYKPAHTHVLFAYGET